MLNNKIVIKIFSIFLVISIIWGNETIIANADTNNYYAQYSGSTSASWGYNPNCTFTIDKIVGNRFRGTFSAQNMDSFLSI